MLCERGIRTFETYTRNTMDISAIPVLKKLTHLPVFGDPSHGVGKREFVRAGAGTRFCRRRGRRPVDGDAPQSRQGHERWRAVAVSGSVDETGGAVAAACASGWSYRCVDVSIKRQSIARLV